MTAPAAAGTAEQIDGPTLADVYAITCQLEQRLDALLATERTATT